jgi:hypothetical protein
MAEQSPFPELSYGPRDQLPRWVLEPQIHNDAKPEAR